MISNLNFDWPWAWLLLLPLLGALVIATYRQRQRGISKRRIAALASLRLAAVVGLVFLAARPVHVAPAPPNRSSNEVLVLLDRSESMSLRENDSSRYQQATEFLRARMLPALESAGLTAKAFLFDENAEAADGPRIAQTTPEGKRTNLGRALVEAIRSCGEQPLAVVALTDGIANENVDNSRALAALTRSAIPVIGIGFGQDEGARTLSLRTLETPSVVSTRTSFSISAHLEMLNADEAFRFDLLLYRDGQLVESKSVDPGVRNSGSTHSIERHAERPEPSADRNVRAPGSRTWVENFTIEENQPGTHLYSVQLVPPGGAGILPVNTKAKTSVRIADERELRVLYVQGALTWDYKFVALALRKDETIKMTGLTRTSGESIFRQNVESTGELVQGFPTTIEHLAAYRLVVLSNLRPADLSTPQQDLLARFCGELGGGILMIGGRGTFDHSWRNSRLEQLLPVTFASPGAAVATERPFRFQPTPEALAQPVFRLAEKIPPDEPWSRVPQFTQYAPVDGAKPGAQVWALHESDTGPQGKRILMACQRYGAGLSAILTVQNFWRWRLAQDSEAEHFDRFWRQLFRYLGDVSRQEISIHLADQAVLPPCDVQVVLEKQLSPGNLAQTTNAYIVRVHDADKKLLHAESLQLLPSHYTEFRFRAARPDKYSVTVVDNYEVPVAARSLELRDQNIELSSTGRKMETLRQWASATHGAAFTAEECPRAAELIQHVRRKLEHARQQSHWRRPAAMNPWVFAAIVGCLGTEWGLRKRWNYR